MNHKNFHFTKISDKTNGVIFLKVQKPCFWAIFDHFWSFLPDEDFFKNSGCQTQLYKDPQDHVKFQKKLMTQLRENLQRDRRTDGRTDRPCFIEPFQQRLGVQKEYNYHYRICLNMSECANINWILNMSWVLNMQKF